MSKRSLFVKVMGWIGILFMWVTPICLPSPTMLLLHCLYYVIHTYVHTRDHGKRIGQVGRRKNAGLADITFTLG